MSDFDPKIKKKVFSEMNGRGGLGWSIPRPTRYCAQQVAQGGAALKNRYAGAATVDALAIASPHQK